MLFVSWIFNLNKNFCVDVNNREHPTKSHPPTGPVAKPSKGKQMPRRTPHQSGYDSDSAVQQHYETPISNHPRRAPSPETWLQNPGGVPVHVCMRRISFLIITSKAGSVAA